ncbi:ATP-binding cassette domain-containing protein [Pararhizobium sp. BT-229]|uniref:ABC transporter ATP-binding protein n=1 Tax=Pararhizobium sp. BT-229 TaxID=2986923 RepID=UPI0021F70F48|nr:Wzt carbohydrate-binding domain-containing protein [Pararhizobium sp. BT-229]MCV9963903.1 ATP-binding cassette domain-containing protein [Pararhizobium sp. BT-229]
MSSEIAISVTDVGKTFAVLRGMRRLLGRALGRKTDVNVLRGVTFQVKKGESVGIVGVNGSGKSTLLQIIAGTMSPTTGSVTIKGKIGAILELGAGFHPEFSGRENSLLGLSLMGLDKVAAEGMVDAVKEFSGLGEYFELPIRTYSSGMYVRLAFSVAISGDPDIMIVDEALAVGDGAFQRKCYEKLAQIKARGGTLLFVSHDEEAVRTMTDKAVLLHKGDMLDFGLSDNIAFKHRSMTLMETRAPEIAGKTFGDGSVSRLDIEVTDSTGKSRTRFVSGEKVTVAVSFVPVSKLDRVNVGLRLRSPTGVKVYSGGTLNADMASGKPGEGFWGQVHPAGQRVTVSFDFDCVLGEGKYEVQLQVTKEDTPDYLAQSVLAWRDEAAVIEVVKDAARFGGLVDLRPSISVKRG